MGSDRVTPDQADHDDYGGYPCCRHCEHSPLEMRDSHRKPCPDGCNDDVTSPPAGGGNG